MCVNISRLLYIHKNRGCRDDILGLFFVFTDVPFFVLFENPKENQYGGKEKEYENLQ